MPRSIWKGAVSFGLVNIIVKLYLATESSSKVSFNLLNSAAETGARVVLNWYHDADDDTIEEFGQELHADFPLIEFHDHALNE